MTISPGRYTPAHRASRAGSRAVVAEPEPTAVAVDSGPVPPPDHLGRRTARGSFITLGGQLAQMILQMTSVIVLARLLNPHDYGLYAMVLIISGIGEIFRDFGLSSAAVQARTLSREQRDQLFWINTGIGVVLAALVFFGAPVIAAIFGQHQLVALARLLSVIFLINGMTTQFRADLNRRMRFGIIALADLLAQVMAVGVAIVCAALGARYWALVGSQIAQVVTVLLMTSLAAHWIPRRPRRGVDVKSLVKFGRNFVGAQLINYASNNVDSVTIGIRFGASPLGLYNRAFQLLMSPLNQLRTPATTVALPVLSRLQDSPERANEYIRRGQIMLGYTIVAGLGFAAGAAQPLVHFLLGNKWTEVTPIFALLAVAAGFQMLSFVGYWVYLSRGLTSDLFRYSFISFGIKIVCILVGSQWGIVGVAAGYAIAPALAWPISLWWLQRKTVIPVADLYRGAFVILGLSTVAGLLSYGACRVLDSYGDLVQIAAALVVSVAAYAVAAVLVPRVRRDFAIVRDFGRRILPSRAGQ